MPPCSLTAQKNVPLLSSLGTKLASIGLIFIIGLGLYSVEVIRSTRQDMMIEREMSLKNLVQIAAGIVDYYGQQSSTGVLSLAEAQAKALEAIKTLRYDGEQYFWINDNQPKMLMHPFKPQLDGTDLSQSKDPTGKFLFLEMRDVVRQKGGGFVHYMWPKPGSDTDQPKLSYVAGYKPWGWIIGTGVYIDDIDTAVKKKAYSLLKMACLILLILGGVAFVVISRITRAMGLMTRTMLHLANGELSVVIPFTDRKDEIGQMSGALTSFQQSLLEMERIQKEEVRKTQAERVKQEKLQAIFSNFEASISTVVENLSLSSNQMRGYAETLSTRAEEVSHLASDVGHVSHSSSQNVSSVAAASEELNASITEIERQVNHSAGMTRQAVDEAHRTNKIVSSMAEAANQIGEVVQLISEIANQTNLLALNATIEAARAGEAGKGFAVVANEVKNLANQTAKATEDISAQVQDIQSVAGNVVGAIQSIAAMIEQISDVTGAIATAVSQQGSASQQISQNVQEAASGTQQVSNDITHVTEAANVTGSIASNVLTAAVKLAEQSEALHDHVHQFVSASKAV